MVMEKNLPDNDLLKVLGEDLEKVKKLKTENERLRKQMQQLLRNNRKFATLVKELDQRLDFSGEKSDLLYDFTSGNMVDKEEVKKKKLDLDEHKLTLAELNKQMQEILEQMKKTEAKA